MAKYVECPDPIEVPDFHFKLASRIKIFDFDGSPPPSFANLIAVARNLGIAFIGTLQGFRVVKTNQVVSSTNQDEYYCRDVTLGYRPTHICISCDQTLLAVGCYTQSGSQAFIYSVASFATPSVSILTEVRLPPNPESLIKELVWNPGVANLLSCCLMDGSVGSVSFKPNSVEINTLPSAVMAKCFCWSPKGKQIVIGDDNGVLTQYKPDLKPVKSLPPPCLSSNGQPTVDTVLWVSNYQFAAAYRDKSHDSQFPVILLVNAVKNDPVVFVNYDDITYSTTLFRPHQLYMLHFMPWNLILISSANSIEMAVLHCRPDASTWEQWLQGDASRAELPLDVNRQETFPLGLALDTSTTEALPWGEGTLPPAPRLLVLSHEGLLSVFHVVNVAEGAPVVCSPPEHDVDSSLFTVVRSAPAAPVLPKAEPSPPPPQTAEPPQPPPVQTQPVAPAGFFTPPRVPFSTPENIHVTPAQTSVLPFSVMPQPQSMPSLPLSDPTPPPMIKPPISTALPSFSKPLSFEVSKSTPPVAEPATISVISPSTSSPGPQTPELATVDDSVYITAILDEVDHFNSELKQLTSKISGLNIQIGTQEEKEVMRKKLVNLNAFWKELKETTASESTEIHSVKEDLIESFAWLEEARLRNRQRKNPHLVQLKRSEELDPVSARRMSEVSHLKYYVENQLAQLNRHLDKEWMDHQDGCREDVKNKMVIPSMENVYKTMHLQLKILNRQRALVEEMKKMADQNFKLRSQPALFIASSSSLKPEPSETTRAAELSKLADNLLQMKISRAEKNPISEEDSWDMILKSRVKAVAERNKKLTTEKQAMLRDALSDRDMVRIRPAKLSIDMSSFVRSSAKIKSSPPKLKPSRALAEAVDEEAPKETREMPKQAPVSSFSFGDSLFSTKLEEVKVDGKSAPPTKNIFSFGTTKPETGGIFMVQSRPTAQKTDGSSPLSTLNGIVSGIGKENVKSAPTASGLSAFTFSANKAIEIPKVAEANPALSLSSLPKPSFAQPISQMGPASKTEVKPTETFSFSLAADTQKESYSFSLPKPKELTKAVPTTDVSSSTTITSTHPKPSPTQSAFASSVSTAASSAFSFAGHTPSSSAPMFSSGSLFPSTPQNSSIFGTPTTSVTTALKSAESIPAVPASALEPPPTSQITSTLFTPKATSTPMVELSDPLKPDSTTPSPALAPVPDSIPALTPIVAAAPAAAPPAPTATPASSQSSAPFSFSIVPQSTASSTLFSAPMFSSTVASSPFTSVFGSAHLPVSSQSEISNTTPSVFSKPSAATAVATSAATAVATSAATAVAVTTTSIFAADLTTTTPSLFGQAAVATDLTTTTPSLFGQAAASPNIFSSISPTTTSSAFGQASVTPTNVFGQTAPFGQKPDSVGQTTNLFGQLLSGNTSGGAFGASPTTTASAVGIFSQSGSPFDPNSGSIFGGKAPASTTTASVFGTSSIFPQATSPSIFGQTTTSTSVFGQSPATTSSSSFFGQTACSPFGSGTSTVVAPNQNPFGSTAFGSKPAFGQSLFGQSSNEASPSLFGTPTSSTSVFGTPSSPSSGGLFQSGATGSFGSTSPGPFSGGQSSVAQSGFGSPPAFQKPLGFGASPGFGGGANATPPSFGSSPTFAGAPTFGSTSAFGSPQKVFGSPQASFGSPQGQSTTFENLANQNTVGFGNLAQQGSSPGFGASPSFGSPPAFGAQQQPQQQQQGSFGGNSFSSWRQ